MTSFNRKPYKFSSDALNLASVIIFALIGCTAAALNQRPLNIAVEMQGQTSFVCSSDSGVPHWVFSSNGKGNKDAEVQSDSCSVYPENAFHFQTQMSNKTCTLTVRNATKQLAGVYTCIDGPSKSDRFSALLTVIDPRPTITVSNQSTVFEGQALNIVCSTSYAGPEAPAPSLAPSIYFSTSDGQRVPDVSLFVNYDQVKAFFSVAAEFPMVPSFTCNVFFPTGNETKPQYATNTPNNTYSWSSPVINVSRESDFKTDAPSWTTAACESGGCAENKQHFGTSNDDERDDWRSKATNQSTIDQSTDDATGGDNNDESTNATDDNSDIFDDDGTTNNTNETTTHYEDDFPERNNKISDTESSENSTDNDIEDERKTSNISETTTEYQTALPNWINSSSTVADDEMVTTDYANETTTNYEVDFSNWKNTTSGSESSENSTNVDLDGKRTPDSISEANTYYYHNDFPNRNTNMSNSSATFADGYRPTNDTYEATIRHKTDFATLNNTESRGNFTDKDIDGKRIKTNTTRDNTFEFQDWNSTIRPTTDSTNYNNSDVVENANNTARTSSEVLGFGADGVTRDNASATRSLSDILNFPIDSFLKSIFGINSTFDRFYENAAPHILKPSFGSLVIAALIFLFFIN